MARKSVFNYKVQRGAPGSWMILANGKTYMAMKGKKTGTWYVTSLGSGSTTFNAGTLRDCILWVCAREGVL